jgi:hypothetical protein
MQRVDDSHPLDHACQDASCVVASIPFLVDISGQGSLICMHSTSKTGKKKAEESERYEEKMPTAYICLAAHTSTCQ